MNLLEVLDKRDIAFDVSLKTKEETLEYLAKKMYDSGKITSIEKFMQSVLRRESIAETGLGDGIAIPHGKDASVVCASIAFVRLKESVEWESLDNEPVKYVFLLAIPDRDTNNEHIAMLSELARSLIRREVIDQVHNARDVETLLEVF